VSVESISGRSLDADGVVTRIRRGASVRNEANGQELWKLSRVIIMAALSSSARQRSGLGTRRERRKLSIIAITDAIIGDVSWLSLGDSPGDNFILLSI
jgi:hypothetical protein